MIIKILGILDIIAAMLFWIFGVFNVLPHTLILLAAFYLLIKGSIFLISADIASVIDILCAIVFFLSLSFVIPKIIVIIISLFLIQKGIFSLLS